jgi:hypothetical protein
MLMKKAVSALFVILLVVLSCSKETVNPEMESGEDFLKGAKLKTKTLKIHESSGTLLYPNTIISCDVCDMCESMSLLYVQGTGHATHLGAFTVINYLCVDQPSVLRGLLTAANGDQIHTKLMGPPVDGVFHYAIEGGSGRFAGAEGYIDMWGLIDEEKEIFELEGLGEIRY